MTNCDCYPGALFHRADCPVAPGRPRDPYNDGGPLGGAAVARSSDPGTSWAAAHSIQQLRERQRAVLRVIDSFTGPLHDAELVGLYGRAVQAGLEPPQSVSGIRTRRKELVRAGCVRDSGRTTRLTSGRHAILWEITEEGRAALA